MVEYYVTVASPTASPAHLVLILLPLLMLIQHRETSGQRGLPACPVEPVWPRPAWLGQMITNFTVFTVSQPPHPQTM